MSLSMFVGIEQPVQMQPTVPPAEAGDTMQVPVTINSVDVQTLESMPPQIQLSIRGSVDGCEFPVQIEQSRDENTVRLDVFREMPVGIACPMILVIFEDTVILNGTFDAGQRYTLRVNDQTVTFTP